MKINLLIFREILVVAETQKIGFIKTIEPEHYTHINFMATNHFIKINKNLKSSEDLNKIGDLTPKGQKYISVFRDPAFTNKIFMELNKRNTDSLEVAYKLAFNKLSESKN